MSDLDTSHYDDKYVVMKAPDFWMLLGYLNDGQRHEHEVEAEANKQILRDAVVIRRQDKFASPCLATYAAMIGLVASEHQNPDIKGQLLRVSDYFEDQARLAAEEGWKLPTP